MSNCFWKDGRFGWPLVSAVVFVTVSLVATDYAWRMVQMPFETLLIVSLAATVTAIGLLVAVYLMLFLGRSPQA